MTNFRKFVAEMTRKSVPARIKETDGQPIVELGWNYPDKLADKVWDIACKFDLEVEICAEEQGTSFRYMTRTGGGPKSY